ncbi:hypothetical protein [Legionella antarctica]|nr:hypothetical protein [Legionella antarctica]
MQWNPLTAIKNISMIVCLLLSPLSIAAPTLNIPQVSLIMTIPNHPQVMILIGNSQSMDGSLSGAIMTGSGSLSSNLSTLHKSR